MLEEVAGLHSDIRWGTEKELTEEDRNADFVPDEAKIREEDQALPGINVEEVACASVVNTSRRTTMTSSCATEPIASARSTSSAASR